LLPSAAFNNCLSKYAHLPTLTWKTAQNKWNKSMISTTNIWTFQSVQCAEYTNICWFCTY
jgi:hypothetical protein